MTALHVAYLGNFEPEHSTENHLRRALTSLGHHVHLAQENDIAAWHTVADRVGDFDLVLWTRTGWQPAMPANLQRRVRANAAMKGVPVVGYHLDRWWGLNREHELRNEFFKVDVLFTADGGHQEQWASIGTNHVWMPPAVLGAECVPGQWREEYDAQVAFVGSWREYHPEWAYRGRLVGWLMETYGDRFKVWDGGVRGADLRDLYASVDVVVGDSCLAGGATHYWSDRVPETTGRGGFLIHPEVEGLAERHPHLATYTLGDFAELGDLIDLWLGEAAARGEVAALNQRHTLENHTYERRMADMIDHLRETGLLAMPDQDRRLGAGLFRDKITVVTDTPRPRIDVHWVTFEPNSLARGYWDQEIIERLIDSDAAGAPHYWSRSSIFEEGDAPEFDQGGVVVLPGRFHATAERVAQVQRLIERMPWVVLILTSDEEALFPWRAIQHPNMRMWVQTPDPAKHDDPNLRLFVFGPSADFADLLPASEPERTNGWVFAGQVTHQRRQEAAEVLRGMDGGTLAESDAFASGLDRDKYADLMASAMVVPCPSGPETPDTFRAWEALDAGAIPILDAVSPKMPDGRYWGHVFAGQPAGAPPVPVVHTWSDLPALCADLTGSWPRPQNRATAWWRGYQAALQARLTADVAELAGLRLRGGLGDLLTVVVTASPVPSHPGSDVLTTTLNSVAESMGEAGDNVQTLLMFDGVSAALEHRRSDYERHISHMLWLTRNEPVVPFVLDDHVHQAGLMRRALEWVHTPLVLFVEHDTPLVGEIDWHGVCRAVLGGAANMVRFMHEARILDEHMHLTPDLGLRVNIEGVPLARTAQWSQRPHVAATDFYRNVMAAHFGAESRTFIEDVLHGALDFAWRTEGEDGWNRWRTWLYAPDGDMKRSTHIDGRAGDPKADMVFAYDGPPPPGTPYPTRQR